jgi:hypothetical protein
METCPECGAVTPVCNIEAHPYFGASKGCWAAYSEILAREYSDPAYFVNHRQTVDAYALQHPAGDDPRAIQSVNIHLIALTLLYGVKMPAVNIPKIMDSIVQKTRKTKQPFTKLISPKHLGKVTVTDILPLTALQVHLNGVDDWANEAWQAWDQHHSVAWHYIRAEGIS